MLAGRYELVAHVGRGGMSEVWRAWDAVSGAPRAIKLIAEPYAGTPAAERRLHREAAFLRAVSHSGVVRLHDDQVCRPGPGAPSFIALDFVPGHNLQCRLATPLADVSALRIGAQVASALAAVHAAGIVHCDVTPANIMLDGERVTLLDFGIAQIASPAPRRRRSDQVFGTPAYIAPERLVDHQVGPPADIYALGLLLYRMLAGRPPWQVDTSVQMLTAHVTAAPTPLPRLPGVPAAVAALCDRCLAKNPGARPTAVEAGRVLAHAAGLPPADDPLPHPVRGGSRLPASYDGTAGQRTVATQPIPDGSGTAPTFR